MSRLLLLLPMIAFAQGHVETIRPDELPQTKTVDRDDISQADFLQALKDENLEDKFLGRIHEGFDR